MNPFLTIGIPTWNRSPFLEKNLGLLKKYLDELSRENGDVEKVEVLVCDNASSDNTEQVCRALAANWPVMRYLRNDENIGANANFERVILSASGEYVWLLGDDDLIAENAIKRVLADLENYVPDIVSGPAIYSDSHKKATHHRICKTMLSDARIFQTEEMYDIFGKISGLILKKKSIEAILPIAHHALMSIKTPWPHIAWIILCLDNNKRNVLILDYGISQLVVENWHNLVFTGSDLFQVLFVDYLTLLIALKPFIQIDNYHALISKSVFSRRNTLLKCVFYATWLDSYSKMVKKAVSFFPVIPGVKNKLSYIFYFMLPVLTPLQIRRGIFYLLFPILRIFSPKIKITFDRIKKIPRQLQGSSSAKRQYDGKGL